MARAKRTTRAEARRRYRAEHGLPDETSIGDEAEEADARPVREAGRNPLGCGPDGADRDLQRGSAGVPAARCSAATFEPCPGW